MKNTALLMFMAKTHAADSTLADAKRGGGRGDQKAGGDGAFRGAIAEITEGVRCPSMCVWPTEDHVTAETYM